MTKPVERFGVHQLGPLLQYPDGSQSLTCGCGWAVAAPTDRAIHASVRAHLIDEGALEA